MTRKSRDRVRDPTPPRRRSNRRSQESMDALSGKARQQTTRSGANINTEEPTRQAGDNSGQLVPNGRALVPSHGVSEGREITIAESVSQDPGHSRSNKTNQITIPGTSAATKNTLLYVSGPSETLRQCESRKSEQDLNSRPMVSTQHTFVRNYLIKHGQKDQRGQTTNGSGRSVSDGRALVSSQVVSDGREMSTAESVSQNPSYSRSQNISTQMSVPGALGSQERPGEGVLLKNTAVHGSGTLDTQRLVVSERSEQDLSTKPSTSFQERLESNHPLQNRQENQRGYTSNGSGQLVPVGPALVSSQVVSDGREMSTAESVSQNPSYSRSQNISTQMSVPGALGLQERPGEGVLLKNTAVHGSGTLDTQRLVVSERSEQDLSTKPSTSFQERLESNHPLQNRQENQRGYISIGSGQLVPVGPALVSSQVVSDGREMSTAESVSQNPSYSRLQNISTQMFVPGTFDSQERPGEGVLLKNTAVHGSGTLDTQILFVSPRSEQDWSPRPSTSFQQRLESDHILQHGQENQRGHKSSVSGQLVSDGPALVSSQGIFNDHEMSTAESVSNNPSYIRSQNISTPMSVPGTLGSQRRPGEGALFKNKPVHGSGTLDTQRLFVSERSKQDLSSKPSTSFQQGLESNHLLQQGQKNQRGHSFSGSAQLVPDRPALVSSQGVFNDHEMTTAESASQHLGHSRSKNIMSQMIVSGHYSTQNYSAERKRGQIDKFSGRSTARGRAAVPRQGATENYTAFASQSASQVHVFSRAQSPELNISGPDDSQARDYRQFVPVNQEQNDELGEYHHDGLNRGFSQNLNRQPRKSHNYNRQANIGIKKFRPNFYNRRQKGMEQAAKYFAGTEERLRELEKKVQDKKAKEAVPVEEVKSSLAVMSALPHMAYPTPPQSLISTHFMAPPIVALPPMQHSYNPIHSLMNAASLTNINPLLGPIQPILSTMPPPLNHIASVFPVHSGLHSPGVPTNGPIVQVTPNLRRNTAGNVYSYGLDAFNTYFN